MRSRCSLPVFTRVLDSIPLMGRYLQPPAQLRAELRREYPRHRFLEIFQLACAREDRETIVCRRPSDSEDTNGKFSRRNPPATRPLSARRAVIWVHLKYSPESRRNLKTPSIRESVGSTNTPVLSSQRTACRPCFNFNNEYSY